MPETIRKSYLYNQKPNLVKEWHPTKNGRLNPRNVTTDYAEKVWWLCEGGHEWEATVNDRIMGSDCPECSKQSVKMKSTKVEDPSISNSSTQDDDNISQKTPSFYPLDFDETYQGIEFRKDKRYKYEATAILEEIFSGKSMYARMHNIGRGGMYFETDTFLNKGEKLRIEFFKPLSFTRRRIFPSTVKWCKGLADDEGKTYGYGLGVKFG